jgi:hypothetical protein
MQTHTNLGPLKSKLSFGIQFSKMVGEEDELVNFGNLGSD